MDRIDSKNILLIVMGLSLIIVACSPEVRLKVLGTFFDDVPSGETELDVATDTLTGIDSMEVFATSSNIVVDKMNYHDPYVNKECAKCHDQQHLGALVAEEPELCYQCHENNNEAHLFKHGPSAAGLCTACHHPHKAKEKKLLSEKGSEFCLSCHNIEDVTNNKIHKEIKEKKDCIECHDPHASDNRFMMKKGICSQCHKEVIKGEFVHGPVSGEFCSACHASHESKNEHLLVQKTESLCLNCHDANAVFDDELHKKEENKNCTICHDPHAGPKKFMLTE